MRQDTSQAAPAKPVVELAINSPLLEEQRRRLVRIKRAIRRKTSGGIRELKMELRGDELLLRGSCSTFYCKQIAQTAAMSYLSGETLINEIEVDARPR
jgi:hypothetical protein